MNAKSLAQIFVLKQHPIVKGMANMKSITPKEMARDLVSHYAKMDNCLKQYTIDLDDLADFDQHKLAATLMIAEDGYANEATGADNPAYETKMLPALLRFLKNSTDRDEEIEFVKEWRDGVSSYMNRRMTELLEDAVYEYNADQDLLYNEDPGFVRGGPWS